MNGGAVDTRSEAARVQVALLRGATVARRVELARSLSRTTMQLAWRASRRAHPAAGADEIALSFAAVHYGRDLADRLRSRVGPRTEIVMTASDIVAAVTPVVEVLDRLGVAYHIGGSVASSAYGVARATLDVDVVADLRPEHVAALAEQLRAGYYVDEAAAGDAVRQQTSFNVIHLQSMIKIDVFVPKARPFDRSELARARQDTLEVAEGARAFLLKSPEDVVLRKLEWFKADGEVSERQWGDVLGVLRVQATALDAKYLQHWAGQLGLTDLLERALREAEL